MKLNFRIVVMSLVLFCAGLLVGCEHTASGFGQDMQSNGKKIENAVDNNK